MGMMIFPVVILGLFMMGAIVIHGSVKENKITNLSIDDINKERNELEVIAKLAVIEEKKLTEKQRMILEAGF